MSVRRASILLPCANLDDWPSHLQGQEAAELLAAWTSLWHPALIHATGSLPGWHYTDEPPDQDTLDGELLIVPSVSRERLPSDWFERWQTDSRTPPPVVSNPSRQRTITDLLAAASLTPDGSPAVSMGDEFLMAGDFLALGYAHLQVELLTRAMRYTTVLDADAFRTAVIDAAHAAAAGRAESARDGLVRAFDLLTDARNHFYGVDFYLVDVTLLAPPTLADRAKIDRLCGEPLRAKLAPSDANSHSAPPTNLLSTGDLLEQIERGYPETLAALRQAIEAGQASVMGGPLHGPSLAHRTPEGMLTELTAGQNGYRRCLGRDPEVYAQFGSGFSPLLPELLSSLGYQAALYTAFDGSRWPRPPQPKSRWGRRGGPTIEMLSATPLNVADPATWLTLGEQIGDSLAREHVATLLLAGWPGSACEYYQDVRRIAAYGPTLGKFVTLEEYFRVTLETDDWATFHPPAYPSATPAAIAERPMTKCVAAYREQVRETFARLHEGLVALVPEKGTADVRTETEQESTVLNPWSFPCPRYVGFEPLDFEFRIADQIKPNSQSAIPNPQSEISFVPDVPSCGYATLDAAAADPPVHLAEGRTLRNEWLQLVVSESTGGIQSLRAHRDRATRVSQRLVAEGLPTLDEACQMIADRIEVTRNDSVAGDITSQGRLVDADARTLTRFVQTMRLVRGLPAAIVDVRLEPEVSPTGSVWNSYYASRLAWRGDAIGVRHGVDWVGRETDRRRIESPDWVEILDSAGRITCLALGLPLHRLAAAKQLDTLLAIANDPHGIHFQFAIGLDCRYPTQTALALLTAGTPSITKGHVAGRLVRSWFLHLDVKNAVVTHVAPLAAPAAGVRLRILETEGRRAGATLSAFRPFRAARLTDFRGESAEALAIADGRVQLEVGPHRWLQIEAEW